MSRRQGGIVSGTPALDPDAAEFLFGTVMRPFLDATEGTRNPFIIFNPKRRYLFNINCGPWNGGSSTILPFTYPDDLPLALPFRGSYPMADPQNPDIVEFILTPFPSGSPSISQPGDFTLTSSGEETHLTAIAATSGPALSAGQYTIIAGGWAYERFVAIRTSDLDDFSWNFAAADPPTEVTIPMEEWFG